MPVETKKTSAPFHSYRQWAEAIAPQLQMLLAAESMIPPQRPFTEAWITMALFWDDSPHSLEGIIATADAINHDIPYPEEIAWALVRLRKRGWLVEQGGSYQLSAEGRGYIEHITGEGGVLDKAERLEEWTLAHPP